MLPRRWGAGPSVGTSISTFSRLGRSRIWETNKGNRDANDGPDFISVNSGYLKLDYEPPECGGGGG